MTNQETKIQPQPPATMAALISVAVASGRKILQDRRYTPDAGSYHTPARGNDNERCHVCEAGAVMAATLGARIDLYHEPSDFGEWERALRALDLTRTGRYDLAAETLHDRELTADELAALYGIRPPEAGGYHDEAAFRIHLDSLEEKGAAIAAAGL